MRAENFCAGAGGSSPASSGSQQSWGSSMVPAGRAATRSRGREPGGGATRGPHPTTPGGRTRPAALPAQSAPPRPSRLAGCCQVVTAERPGAASLLTPPSLPLLPSPTSRARRRARSARMPAWAQGPPRAWVCWSEGSTGAARPCCDLLVLVRGSFPATAHTRAYTRVCTHENTRAHTRAHKHWRALGELGKTADALHPSVPRHQPGPPTSVKVSPRSVPSTPS